MDNSRYLVPDKIDTENELSDHDTSDGEMENRQILFAQLFKINNNTERDDSPVQKPE